MQVQWKINYNNMKWVVIVFLCGLFALGSTDMCSKNITIKDMPKGLIAEIVTITTLGIVADFKGCSIRFQVDPNKIGFWLYNTANPNTPIRLDHDNPSQINPTEKSIFIIHGWTCNITGNGFPQMKDAYLKKYPNANIIVVEWTTYAVDLYVNSFCYIPKIAELVGKFICNLNSKFNVDISQLHLVGHSFGGQISGLTGQETKSQCNKTLGRITALDPAGPLYQMVSASRRLDASDATMVDVIHTNQGQLGYYGSCGTVDYYPNCGYYQPGCLELKATLNVSYIFNLPLDVLVCNHQRSIDYFNESILSDGFKAKSCTACPGLPPVGPCIADLFSPSSSIMGESHDKFPSTATKYYLKTGSESPYAKS